MKVYPTARTIITLAALSITLLVACGQQPYDPYAAQKQDLAYQQQAQQTQLAMQQQAFLAPFERLLLATVLLSLAVAPIITLWTITDLYRRRRRLVMPNSHGVLPLPRPTIEQDARPAIAALGAFHATEYQRASGTRTLPLAPSAPALITSSPDVPTPALPMSTVDLSSLVGDWRPSLQSILLAVGPGGVRYTVHARDLCHVALAGATGGGKSNIMRLVLSQLQAAGAKVVLADPHFAPIDVERGDDWRPIAQRLHLAPAVRASDIGDLLAWLATDELPQRLERRRAGQSAGMPLFLALDELPAIVADVKAAPDHMARLLREGRKANLFVVGAAQDWLAKTLGGSGAVRDCYRTAYYVGGDTTSARVLLDITGRVDDGQLGQGLAMLRSKATPTAQLVRVPLTSNDAISRLLDVTPIGVKPINEAQAPVASQDGSGRVIEAEPCTEPVVHRDEPCTALEPARTDGTGVPDPAIVQRMAKAGMSQNQILELAFGVTKGGSRAYQQAREQYRAIVEQRVA